MRQNLVKKTLNHGYYIAKKFKKFDDFGGKFSTLLQQNLNYDPNKESEVTEAEIDTSEKPLARKHLGISFWKLIDDENTFECSSAYLELFIDWPLKSKRNEQKGVKRTLFKS